MPNPTQLSPSRVEQITDPDHHNTGIDDVHDDRRLGSSSVLVRGGGVAQFTVAFVVTSHAEGLCTRRTLDMERPTHRQRHDR